MNAAPGCLAGWGGCEEDFLQDRIALEFWVAQVSGQNGLVEMHDVLTATRRRADEHHSSKDVRSHQGHLLCDHPAE
jgi:hypothetical protein